ncbi:MAG: glycosyltransferase [Candidatus Hydrogenedentales bacterium]|jgi:tetratricopeptide (TPR) repeat protein
MRVLCLGIPFFCNESPVALYRGPHEVKTLGVGDTYDFAFDSEHETATQVVLRIARTWTPELLLCWMPEAFPPPFGIEHAPLKTVALVSDWNVYYPVLATNLARYDLVLCDKPGTEALRSTLVHPHHAMPLYSAITPLHRRLNEKKDIDVLFAGNLSPAAHRTRARYLERLAPLLDRYRVVFAGGVFGEDYVRLLNRARLVFNHSIRGEMNLRVFETLACGSTALLESGNLEVRDHLKPDEEIVLYDAGDFEERIIHLLEHPHEAQAIADCGHRRAAGLAGENRLTALIDWAAREPSSGRLFHTVPEAERRYQDVLMYGQSRFAGHRVVAQQMLNRLAGEHSKDPRVWTAASGFISPPVDEIPPDRARNALIKAHTLAPDSAIFALNAASACLFCGDNDAALEYLEKALQCDSLDGQTCLMGSVSQPFVVRWRRSVAEGTASTAMLRAETHIRTAHLLSARGDLPGAETHAMAADALDPGNSGAVLLWANILWVTGRKVEAAELLQRRLADLPLDFEARQQLCDMLADIGMREEALALARTTLRIVRAFPDDPASL